MSLKINQIRLYFSVLTSFLLLFQSGLCQYNFNELSSELEAKKKVLGDNVVALVWKDSLIYKKEMGEFNAKTQAPIASSSKWLTAALIMTFVDQGKLDLDDPVARYIPIFEKYAKSYLTIRHCLSHTTGIETDQGRLVKLLQRKKFPSLEEEVNAFAAREIINNPGQEFHYGGIGLNIAARVTEIVGKKSFDRLIQERILRPLKMRGTSFANDEGGAINPSGGARSTANDYMNFMMMILNKGVFEGKRILSEASIEAMQTCHFPDAPVKYAPPAAQGFAYGLGEWILESDGNGKATVVSSPGLFGTWPYVDNCRGYAAIFFVKTLLGEQKRDVYLRLKEIIDEQIRSKCK